MIHPGKGEEAPLEILDILESAGADVSHTVIAHMDRTMFRDENVLKLAKRSCYIEYDLFGTECSHYQVNTRAIVIGGNGYWEKVFAKLSEIEFFAIILLW